jgi:hypothetical protein
MKINVSEFANFLKEELNKAKKSGKLDQALKVVNEFKEKLYPGFGPEIEIEFDNFPVSFYVVEKIGRTDSPSLGDIVYESNIVQLMRAAKGGLDPEHIHGIYLSKDDALKRAKQLISGGNEDDV